MVRYLFWSTMMLCVLTLVSQMRVLDGDGAFKKMSWLCCD